MGDPTLGPRETLIVRNAGLGVQTRRFVALVDDIEAAVRGKRKPERIADLLKMLRETAQEHQRQPNADLWENRSRIPHSTEAVADAALEGVETRFGGLTPRERQVLELVLKGKSNKQIAEMLAIGRRTVETHRASVMKKVGARSILELVILTIVGPLDNT